MTSSKANHEGLGLLEIEGGMSPKSQRSANYINSPSLSRRSLLSVGSSKPILNMPDFMTDREILSMFFRLAVPTVS